MHWPEEEPPSPDSSKTRGSLLVGPDPLLRGSSGASLEVFDSPANDASDTGLARRWPLLIVIAVLLIIGAALFVLGPLPTIFPTMSCNGCWVPRG
jgi:hypothetical protein